jgi:hypothetical protein
MFGKKDNKMNEVKNIVSSVLLEQRKKRLDEAYIELDDIRDGNYLIGRYLNITQELVNEGYDIDEIEIPDSVKNLVPDQLKTDDVKTALTDALAVSAKEYIIRFVLKEVFGAGAGFSTFAAQLFADWNPLDLLKIFKNKEECDAAFPNLSDRLITMLVRYIAANEIGSDRNNYGINFQGMGTTYLGNLFGEAIKESNVSERIANKFCEFIH